MISLVIPGEPCGKQRPKFVRATGRAYTPEKTVNAETLIRETFASAYPGHEPLAGPLKMIVIAYFSIPKSASAKRRAAMRAQEEWPTKKPDASNILKLAEDALNGLAYRDDSQVVSAVCRKVYSERPRLEIFVNEMGP